MILTCSQSKFDEVVKKLQTAKERVKRPNQATVLDKLRNCSRFLGDNQHLDIQPKQKKMTGEVIHATRFVHDTMQALTQRRETEKNTCFMPLPDLLYAIVAMFFDSPLQHMHAKQKDEAAALELTQPAYLPMLVFFAPLFIHADSSYLKEFWATNPRDPISQTFLEPLFGEENKTPTSDSPTAKISSVLLNTALRGAGIVAAAAGSHTLGVVLDGIRKDVLQVRNNPSHVGKSHQWDDPHAEPFRNVSDNLLQVATVLHSRQPTAPIERAQLMSWLINMASPPDVLTKIIDLADLNEYERRSIDYSIERFLSTGIFLSNISLLKNQTAVSYPYVQSSTIPDHIVELYERYVSRLSGYRYPYTAAERPLAERYKDPMRIIEFLHFNIASLSHGIQENEKNEMEEKLMKEQERESDEMDKEDWTTVMKKKSGGLKEGL
jgi:hypothetical protein